MTQQFANYQPPQGANNAYPNPVPATRGCFGMAWDDVTGSQGYIKKAMLMALIAFVPILNFVNAGYAWNWARQVAFGQRTQLPNTIVNGENFKIGFFALVVDAVVAIILYIESFIITWLFAVMGRETGYGVVAIASILVVVLAVFVGMFGALAKGRMATFGSLGQGFAVGQIMNGYKQRLGSLFCVTYVPAIIASLIAGVIQVIVLVVASSVIGINMMGMGAAGLGNSDPSYIIAYAISSGGVVLMLLALVAVFATYVMAMFAVLVSARGVAHYIARFAPLWAGEATAEAMANQAALGAQQQPAGPGFGGAPQPMYDPNTGKPLNNQAQATVGGVAGSAGAAGSGSAAGRAGAAGGGSAAGSGGAAGSGSAAGRAGAAGRGQASQPVQTPVQAAAPTSETSVLQQVPQHSQSRTDVPDYNYDTVVGLQHESAAPAWMSSAGGSAAPQKTVAKPNDSDTMVLGGKTASPKVPTLRITRSNGQSCDLTSFPVTIGKGSEADLVIEGNPAISRLHVRLLNEGDTFAVEDLEATNKTMLGSYELPPHVPTILSNGDTLKLANEVLRIEIR